MSVGSAVCTVFGDPHYKTFDGKMFNFQGHCKYILSQDCVTNQFTIKVRNDARFTRAFSWTKGVVITLPGFGVKLLLLQNLVVKVNGKRVPLPYLRLGELSVVKQEYTVVVRTQLGLKVVWDGDSYVEVALSSHYRGKVCGLCGNYNRDPTDDMATPTGNLVTNPILLGDAWRKGGKQSCPVRHRISMSEVCGSSFSHMTDTGSTSSHMMDSGSTSSHMTDTGSTSSHMMGSGSTSSHMMDSGSTSSHMTDNTTATTGKVEAVKECAVFKQQAFRPCYRLVNPNPYYRSCLTDMCECSIRRKCACESVIAYGRACARRGITLDWHKYTSCKETKCHIEGAVFSPCVDRCPPRTCSDPSPPCPSTMSGGACRAGCSCPAGQVLHRGKCLAKKKCPKPRERAKTTHFTRILN